MMRFLAGAGACLLFVTGAFLLWQGQAQEVPRLPEAPAARDITPSMLLTNVVPKAPEATAQSREQKRFARADKDKDGRIAREELLGPRRKAYAKLDADHSGSVSSTNGRSRRSTSSAAPTRIIRAGCRRPNSPAPHRRRPRSRAADVDA
ncbi:MAG: histidine kinase [Sphingomicrobium sp.]